MIKTSAYFVSLEEKKNQQKAAVRDFWFNVVAGLIVTVFIADACIHVYYNYAEQSQKFADAVDYVADCNKPGRSEATVRKNHARCLEEKGIVDRGFWYLIANDFVMSMMHHIPFAAHMLRLWETSAIGFFVVAAVLLWLVSRIMKSGLGALISSAIAKYKESRKARASKSAREEAAIGALPAPQRPLFQTISQSLSSSYGHPDEDEDGLLPSASGLVHRARSAGVDGDQVHIEEF